ncbi:MAG: uroporphyrinogen decarboxylase family protein [Bryobacteraceae bacterium]
MQYIIGAELPNTKIMTRRERVMCAVAGGTPDRVPYCELGIDEPIACQLLGRSIRQDKVSEAGEYADNPVDVEKDLSRAVGRDNIRYNFCPPIPAEKHVGEGNILFYGDGQIKSKSDLDKLVLPDPDDDRLYAPAREFLAKREDFAVCAACRLGISPTYLCMGQEFFSLALYDEPDLVEEVLRRYTEWSAKVMARISTMGFDLIWTADDIAFKTGLLLSPKMFRERILPHIRKVAEAITIPWIFHSDGNLTAVLDDIVDLGIAGLHPIEPDAMDIRDIKKRYGKRICLAGNVNVHTLACGSTEQVEEEVKGLLRDVAPGGGYIMTSGNSLASYCKVGNIRAMMATLERYGRYPIEV